MVNDRSGEGLCWSRSYIISGNIAKTLTIGRKIYTIQQVFHHVVSGQLRLGVYYESLLAHDCDGQHVCWSQHGPLDSSVRSH